MAGGRRSRKTKKPSPHFDTSVPATLSGPMLGGGSLAMKTCSLLLDKSCPRATVSCSFLGRHKTQRGLPARNAGFGRWLGWRVCMRLPVLVALAAMVAFSMSLKKKSQGIHCISVFRRRPRTGRVITQGGRAKLTRQCLAIPRDPAVKDMITKRNKELWFFEPIATCASSLRHHAPVEQYTRPSRGDCLPHGISVHFQGPHFAPDADPRGSVRFARCDDDGPPRHGTKSVLAEQPTLEGKSPSEMCHGRKSGGASYKSSPRCVMDERGIRPQTVVHSAFEPFRKADRRCWLFSVDKRI